MNVNNRKCIRKLSFKTLWASRKRNLIAVIAIILTTLLFTSLFTVAMSMNASYETYNFRQAGGYGHGTFKEVTEEQAEAISGHPLVKAAGMRTVVGTSITGVFGKVPAEISYMDDNCAKWSYASPTTGHAPEKENEVSMDTESLRLLGIQPQLGTEIPLTYVVGDKNQMASSEKTDTFVLSGYWEYDSVMPVHYINISKDYMKKVEQEAMSAGMTSFRNDLNVMMSSSLNIEGQMKQVDEDLGYTWDQSDSDNNVRIGVNWGYTSAQLDGKMDAPTLISLVAFLALIIFTGYLIIYNIFQISVTGDIRFYGLLKTIGVTPRQLRRIIRQQALLLCSIGIPAGLLLGYGAGAFATPVIMSNTTMGASVTTISASPFIFILSAVFALATVLLSCSRPGRIAGRVSPVEATKYTETIKNKQKNRSTRGARIHQMAYANLGRSRLKTALVVVSLSLSVVLLNELVLFVNGFDMEKYLDHSTCADFIVSSTDYFRFTRTSEDNISSEIIDKISANTSQTASGRGYFLAGMRPLGWIPEEKYRKVAGEFISTDEINSEIKNMPQRDGMIGPDILMEGLDNELFEKVNVVDGDLSSLFSEDIHSIALDVNVDDYGNVSDLEKYPAIGDKITVTYYDEYYDIDSRTGEKSNDTTPEEYLEFHVEKSHDIEYTVCAYITVPYSMSPRYSTIGYKAVLPADILRKDSGKEIYSLFYLFDTPDQEAEAQAEQYLTDLTADDRSSLMYESKDTMRKSFQSFQSMFILLGGLLCGIIGLVGILNFINAILTGILSRKREFAVLQAVGMTNRQLRQMLIYEGLFYTLGSSAAALILSAILNPLTGNLMGNMFWFFSPHFTLLPVLLAIPVFALAGCSIPSVIYGQAAKLSVVDRLRDAE